jgi:SET domain-containing protein
MKEDDASTHPTTEKSGAKISTKETTEGSTVQPKSETNLYTIKDGSKGRGLFSSEDIQPRTLIHEAPCLRVVKDEYDKYMRFTILEHYLFNADAGDKLLALGHGSLFNHSRQPNVDYRIDSANLCIRYYAGHKAIQKDEELCIYYGDNLWFDDSSLAGSNESSESEPDVVDGVASFLNRMEL